MHGAWCNIKLKTRFNNAINDGFQTTNVQLVIYKFYIWNSRKKRNNTIVVHGCPPQLHHSYAIVCIFLLSSYRYFGEKWNYQIIIFRYVQQTTAQCQRNCCALENIMYDKCSKRCNYGRRKKERDTFFPISTPAICYCGCSASCAYIFFLVHCLGTIFQFIVKLKTQYNSIQFRNHTHTIKFITRIFFPVLIATCYFILSVILKLFPAALPLFLSVCACAVLYYYVLSTNFVCLCVAFFFGCALFSIVIGLVWWDVIVVVVILPQFKRMDVVPLSYLSSAFYTYSNTNTSKVLYDTRILRSWCLIAYSNGNELCAFYRHHTV